MQCTLPKNPAKTVHGEAWRDLFPECADGDFSVSWNDDKGQAYLVEEIQRPAELRNTPAVSNITCNYHNCGQFAKRSSFSERILSRHAGRPK